MTGIGIASIGLVGPGIANWQDATAILRGNKPFEVHAEIPRASSSLLPPNERRRATKLTQMVLQCCEDALPKQARSDSGLTTVFASSCGDLETVDKILQALTTPDKPVSPTLFHNSVHNAPAGYWSIATRNQSASTSISAHDSSFAAGLLEAMSQVQTGAGPTLLTAYDYTAPPTLQRFRPLLAPFAVCLVLDRKPAHWTLVAELKTMTQFSHMEDTGLEMLRTGNPAARCLPLLASIAANLEGEVTIPYLSNLGLALTIRRDD